jgi:hypothetical protein
MADVIRQWIKGQLASAESESHEKECDAHMDFSPAQGRGKRRDSGASKLFEGNSQQVAFEGNITVDEASVLVRD